MSPALFICVWNSPFFFTKNKECTSGNRDILSKFIMQGSLECNSNCIAITDDWSDFKESVDDVGHLSWSIIHNKVRVVTRCQNQIFNQCKRIYTNKELETESVAMVTASILKL